MTGLTSDWINSRDDASFRFKSIVGIGVGAGAYVLAKFAVSHLTVFYHFFLMNCHFGCVCSFNFVSFQLIFPELVEGLVLLNIDPNGKGWIDWAATKVAVSPLSPGGHRTFLFLWQQCVCVCVSCQVSPALCPTLCCHTFSAR